MTHLVWLRRDLRLTDNPALYHACQDPQARVIALYLITKDIWAAHDDAPVKISFWLENLEDLQTTLSKKNIPLLVFEVQGKKLDVLFSAVIKQYAIKKLFFNERLEPNEKDCDREITQLCKERNIGVFIFQQSCIFSPGAILKKNKKPYTMFGPFRKKWLECLSTIEHKPLPIPTKRTEHAMTFKNTNLDIILRKYSTAFNHINWPIGETEAQTRLKRFCKEKIMLYDKKRDLVDIHTTSEISPYLTAGVLSPRACLDIALKEEMNAGREKWIDELIWRDFYQHILHFFPRIGQHCAFDLQTERLGWHNNEKHFQAWCLGKTGVPIIDAAMRQLNETGWIHNRLRMICAMFLSKNLWINWRLGERYFMQHLLDGDLAANNGGWQWCASTGTDPVPYFRIFNPYLQSQRCDKLGHFIRHYCPELSHLNQKEIHQPPKMLEYPEAIVNIHATRLYAIEQFKKLSNLH